MKVKVLFKVGWNWAPWMGKEGQRSWHWDIGSHFCPNNSRRRDSRSPSQSMLDANHLCMLEEYSHGLFLLTAWHSAGLHGDSQMLLHWFSALQVSLSQVHTLLHIILILVHGTALCNMQSLEILLFLWFIGQDFGTALSIVILLHQKKTS